MVILQKKLKSFESNASFKALAWLRCGVLLYSRNQKTYFRLGKPSYKATRPTKQIWGHLFIFISRATKCGTYYFLFFFCEKQVPLPWISQAIQDGGKSPKMMVLFLLTWHVHFLAWSLVGTCMGNDKHTVPPKPHGKYGRQAPQKQSFHSQL